MAQRAVVHFKCVGRVHAQRGLTLVLVAQRGCQVAIDLDHIQAPGGGKKRCRQGALTGTNLHQRLAWTRADTSDDACDDFRIVQEVLSEPFASAHAEAGGR